MRRRRARSSSAARGPRTRRASFRPPRSSPNRRVGCLQSVTDRHSTSEVCSCAARKTRATLPAVMRLAYVAFAVVVLGCGPATRSDNCVGDACNGGTCDPGETRDCYTGHMDTEGVGPCIGGTQMCLQSGMWGNCVGQVVPAPEICSDGIDNNCNGMVDEDIDADGDGYTTCGGDCCDSTECANPARGQPRRVRRAGRRRRRRLRRHRSTTRCRSAIRAWRRARPIATDFAKAIDICQIDDDGRQEVGRDRRDAHARRRHRRAGSELALDPPRSSARDAMPQAGVEHGADLERRRRGKGDTNPAYHDRSVELHGHERVGLPGGLPRGERRQAAERAGLPRADRRPRRTTR